MKKASILITAFVILLAACSKDPDMSIAPQVYHFSVPDGWPQPAYTFANNPLSKGGFELGRKLFYDVRLSRDYSTACGTCHQSFAAFSNLDHIVSHGVDGQLGTRNSPGLFNLAWQPTLMWDGGVNNLEIQPLSPIQNHVEMDMTMDSIAARVGADSDYRSRIIALYGNDEVNAQRLFRALAQFMAMMISDNAKYDHYMRHEPGGDMTASELAGQQVFQNHCATCHQPPLFSDYSYRNNGLSYAGIADDSGRGRITGDVADMHKFKVPSLRNLKYSPPYMHDGRFRTLDEVLDHYDHGIAPSSTLDPLLQSGISLTNQQRQDLLAFLNTLNDDTYVHDTRFTQP